MKVIYLDIVDWEPAAVRFFLSDNSNEGSVRFENFVTFWLQNAKRPKGCKCHHSFAHFLRLPGTGEIELQAEWLCPKCLQALADEVKEHFPMLSRVEFGFHVSELDRHPYFINVPTRKVELEDGTKSIVSPFSIARRPVTTEEFERFTEHASYITSAELKGDSQTFRNHPAIFGLKGRARALAPVSCVSFEDAVAYCAYAEARLPTESEWLAAAIKDIQEIDIDSGEELKFRSQPVPADLIVSTDWDITATRTRDGKVIARSGPLHFLKKGWRNPIEMNYHRKLIDPDEYDLMITFRVIKDSIKTLTTHQ